MPSVLADEIRTRSPGWHHQLELLLPFGFATEFDIRVVILRLRKPNCVLDQSPFDAVRSQQSNSSTNDAEPVSGHAVLLKMATKKWSCPK